ncbi:hypothetical protein [Rhodospirillum sp. A1_3_36]|uniref:hypothetical protein n=1 Tax=Rhodospirillum sp. A1_3_36 TaxID=3391666 RepID=UPI0039A4BD75
MSQTLIDALDALESQVAGLSRAVKAADPVKVGQMAEQGAARGSSETLIKLSETTKALQTVTSDLRQWAIPAAQRAQEAELRRKWWKPALIVLTVLLSLFSGFAVGVLVAQFGLTMTTQIGCLSLGGKWAPRQDGSGSVCWQDSF